MSTVENVPKTPTNRMVPPLTEMEKKAVSDAREALYNSLVKIGIEHAFDNSTKEEMLSVIEAVWGGVRESMQRQSIDDDIPF